MTVLDTAALGPRERYQLLTSLVVPRPVAWVSTRSASGANNLAPYSYFAALSATPFLVGISVGSRRGTPKDTLTNVRESGGFCVNFASRDLLDPLNHSAGEWGPEVDEFERAGVSVAQSEVVPAPFVAEARAVLECRLAQEVRLEGSANTLLVGEVLRVRLAAGVTHVEGTHFVDHATLDPVSRLWGDHYATLGELVTLPRPAT